MTPLQKANFENLVESYFHSTGVERASALALKVAGGRSKVDLAWLLRHHEEGEVSDTREINWRADFDGLIGFYGVLEIALICGFIAAPKRADKFWRNIHAVLSEPSVRKFYVRNYPLKLPQLLRYRLEPSIRFNLRSQRSARSVRLFLDFLELDQRFNRSFGDGVLFDLLDDFWIDGVTIDKLERVIEDPEEYWKHLLLNPRQSGVLSVALRELQAFIQFCVDLHRLLIRCSSDPLLQSAIWHSYGYWFEVVRDSLDNKLRRGIQAFMKWTTHAQTQRSKAEVARSVNSALKSLDALVSGRFARRVDQAITQARRSAAAKT